MSSSTTSLANLSPLIDWHSNLAALLQRTKSTKGSNPKIGDGSPNNTEIPDPDSADSESVYEQVKLIINKLLNYAISVKDPVLKRGMATVMDEIEGILQEFVEIGKARADSYKKLWKEVNVLKSQVKQSSSASTATHSSLVHCGSCLADLLLRAKTTNGGSKKTEILDQDSYAKRVHGVVEAVIDGLLEYSNSERDPVLNESMVKVMRKIQEILHELVKIYSYKAVAEPYKKLIEKVNDFISLVEKSSADHAISSSLPAETLQAASSISSEKTEQECDEFQSKLENLTADEKQCLFCFSLFPQDVAIKKRDLIFMWIGMGLVSECSDGEGKLAGEQVIRKLVAKGLVDSLIINKKLSSKYRMHASIHSKVTQAAVIATQEGSFSAVHDIKDFRIQQPKSEKIEGLLNITEHFLDAKTLERVSKMKDAKVVHLGSWGSWHQGKTNKEYIVIEDIESLQKALRNLGQVRFLGLQGISGIVKLPDSVCKLENLEVLDLRACNNLELLPEGIGSLQKLTHLDLSECFLLDHIPKNIVALSNLTVLKGFVVNSDQSNSTVRRTSIRKSNASSCAFSDLLKLKKLRKLTLRTRRMNFPTRQDLQTLCHMQHLSCLKIAWVGNSSDCQIDGDLDRFPASIEKLELRTLPTRAACQLLGLISKERDSRLEKLYIKGGGLRKLDPEKHYLAQVNEVRLRYLSKLDMDWDDFLKSFPNLTCLEVFECPYLTFFPGNENGWWEK